MNQDEGWVVQVYGRNRRLLCVLESSHGWSFLMGCLTGVLISVIWINATGYRSHPPLETTSPQYSPALQVD